VPHSGQSDMEPCRRAAREGFRPGHGGRLTRWRPLPVDRPLSLLSCCDDAFQMVGRQVSTLTRLTLGALYRALRAGVADAGWVRVSLEFRERTITASALSIGDAAQGPSMVLQALVDHQDGALDRAELMLSEAGPSERLMVRRRGEAYAYSIDGGQRWGRFTARPRILDLREFEGELGEVAVDDVIVEPVSGLSGAVEPEGTRTADDLAPRAPLNGFDALDVNLDRAAFTRLLRIFSADVDEDLGALALSAFSVSLEAAEDVSLLCWWSLNGPEVAAAEPAPLPDDARALRVSCSVSIRVAPVEAPPADQVELSEGLPEVARLDDVWALLRSRRGGPPVSSAG